MSHEFASLVERWLHGDVCEEIVQELSRHYQVVGIDNIRDAVLTDESLICIETDGVWLVLWMPSTPEFEDKVKKFLEEVCEVNITITPPKWVRYKAFLLFSLFFCIS